MKPGSIVVVLPFEPVDQYKPFIKWLPVADEKTPYMLRNVMPSEYDVSGIMCNFEEGVIGYDPLNPGVELCIGASKLRELLPPEDISEMIEEIQTDFVTLPLNV